MTKEEGKIDSDRKRLKLETNRQREEEKPMTERKTSPEKTENLPANPEEHPKARKSMIKGIWKRLSGVRSKNTDPNGDDNDRTQNIGDEELNDDMELNSAESHDSESDFDSDSDSDSDISIDEDSERELLRSLPRVPSLAEFQKLEKLQGVAETSISQGSLQSKSTITVSTHGVAGAAVARTAPRVDLQDLARTQFPDFFMESSGVPSLDMTDGSDDEDEATLLQKREKYSTKEDEDVAVFMSLARRMNLKSLLHLLQGHVQSTYPQYLPHYKAAIQSGDDSDSTNPNGKDAEEEEEVKPDKGKKIVPILKKSRKGSVRKEKQFRWALVTNGAIRKVVYEVECLKAEKQMWWAPHEMAAIRHELIDIVHYFRKHKSAYIRSVEMVARQSVDEFTLEEHLKRLSEDTYARGLETHIVQLLSTHRKSTIEAVIDEQRECRGCGDDKETTEHCLREQSVAYSQLSTRFAYSMGRLDQIDALKASISRWKTTKARFGMK